MWHFKDDFYEIFFFFIFVYLKFSLEHKVWVKNDWFLFLSFFFRYIFCHFDRIFSSSSGGCHILHLGIYLRGFAFIEGWDDDRFIGIMHRFYFSLVYIWSYLNNCFLTDWCHRKFNILIFVLFSLNSHINPISSFIIFFCCATNITTGNPFKINVNIYEN